MKIYLFDHSGAAALIAIVIIASVTTTIALSISLLGIGELDLSYSAGETESAIVLADSCTEEVLRRLRYDENWAVGAGTQVLSIGGNSCTITVTSDGGTERAINSIGNISDYYATVEAVTVVSGGDVSLTSWQLNP
ncbi:MAG: hypothetical protein Q8P90_06095 [bacterium]|nr:hypothetical protein [bacterium]